MTPDDPDKAAERDAVFVTTFLECEDQDDAAVIACRRAGIIEPHFPIAVTARRTLDRPEIQLAIKASRSVFKKRGIQDITVDTLLTDLEEIFHSTLLTRDHAAANANRKLVAQLKGLLSENIHVHHTHDVKSLSDEELMKIARRKGKVIDGSAIDITPKGIGHMKLVGDSDSG